MCMHKYVCLSVCLPVSVGVCADLVRNVSSLFMHESVHVGKSFLHLFARKLLCVHMSVHPNLVPILNSCLSLSLHVCP